MTTIADPAPPMPPTSERRARRVPRRGWDRMLLAWPVGLFVLLALAATWRFTQQPAPAQAPPSPSQAVQLGERRFGDVRIAVPRTWQSLSRSRDHASWGTPDRTHTVTVASIEASVLPLPGVVAESVRETGEQLPGARMVGRPRGLQLEPRAHPDDAAMVVRYEASGLDGEPLQVAQVWRRDTRSERDLIATWTSSDGAWPVSMAQGMPRTTASR